MTVGSRQSAGRWAVPLVVFLAATGISLVRAPDVAYWTDEAASLSAAGRSVPELWAMVQNIDAVHATYYLLLHGWTTVFGASPLATRSLSALAIGGTCLGVWALTRRLVDGRLAILAAAAAALLPRLTWAGIEARPAAFTALCAVWATFLLVRAWEGRWGRWVAYAAVVALGMLFSVYVALLVVAHGVSTLIVHRRSRRVVIANAASALLAFVIVAPLLLLVRSQQGQLGTGGERSPVVIAGKMLVSMLFLGETPSDDATAPWFTLAWKAAAFVAAALGVGLMVLAVVRRTWAPSEKSATAVAVLLPWLVLPPLVVAVYSVFVSPLFQPRYFTFVAPAAAILIAAGIRALPRTWLRIAVVVVYAAAVVVIFASQRTDYAKNGSDWQTAAAVIAERTAPGDLVYFTPRYPYPDGVSHVTARRMAVAYPDAYSELVDLTLVRSAAETATLDGYSRSLEAAMADLTSVDRVWVLYGTHYPDEIIEADERVLSDAGFDAYVEWTGPRSVIVRYERE